MFQSDVRLSGDGRIIVKRSLRLRVAHASRVLVAVSRRNELFLGAPSRNCLHHRRKVREGEDAIGPSRTGASARDARATQICRVEIVDEHKV